VFLCLDEVTSWPSQKALPWRPQGRCDDVTVVTRPTSLKSSSGTRLDVNNTFYTATVIFESKVYQIYYCDAFHL